MKKTNFFSFKKIFLILFIVVFLFLFFLLLNKKSFGLSNVFDKDGLNIVALDLGGTSLDDDIRKDGAYGDAIIIEQDGNYLLMDSGTDDINDTLLTYLKNNGINKFSIYLSHYHSDHFGKIKDIFNDSYFTVDKLYVPSIDGYLELDTEENKNKSWYEPAVASRIRVYELFKGYAAQTNTEVVDLKTGSELSIGDATLKVLWYNFDEDISKRITPDLCSTDGIFLNNSSLVSMIEYKGKKYFTGGDIEESAERVLLEKNIDISADIMKLSHHGSIYSNISEFVNKVNPKYILASNNYTAGNNHILWFGERNSSFANLANRLDEKSSLASTLYNGNVQYNISLDGKITVEMSRNYSLIKIKFLDENNQDISDSISYIVNNKSKSHIFREDYVKNIDSYNLSFIENEINNDIVSDDVVVICHYVLKTSTVTFNSNGGSNVSPQTIDYNGIVSKPVDPTRMGYTFIGWKLNGQTYDFNTPVTSDIILVAEWEEVLVEDTLIDILENNNYVVNNGNVSKFTLGDTVTEIKNKLGSNVIIETDKEIISTGAVIKKDMESYTVVIKGDLTGDGRVNSGDLLQMRKHLLEDITLTGAYKEAGMIESIGNIKSLDLLRLRQYLLGEYEFN